MASRLNRRLSSLARGARRRNDDAFAETLEAVVASEQAHVVALLRAFALLQRQDERGLGLHEAMWQLRILSATKAVPALNRIVVNRSLDFGTRCSAIQALGMIGSRRAAPSMVAVLLEDEHDRVRGMAANALSRIADPRAKAALYQIATDKDAPANVRGDAIETLTNHADDRRIPVLLEALHDPSAEVRFWAVFTLGQVGGADVLPELERLATTDDEVVPHWWSVGREAQDAIEAIRARTEGHDDLP